MKRKSKFIKKDTISEHSTLTRFGFFKKANVATQQTNLSPLVNVKVEKTEDIETETETENEKGKTLDYNSITPKNNNQHDIPLNIAKNEINEEKEVIKRDNPNVKNWNPFNIKKDNKNVKDNTTLPLHKQIEPTCKEDFVHEYRSKKNPLILQLLNDDISFNLIIHGPPGSGKSALINILKNKTHHSFINLIHMNSFNNEIKKIHDQSLTNYKVSKKKTIVCVKDIHRLNKTQQDNLLLILKTGHVYLLATCLENPMNQLNPSLLSRCMLLYFPPYNYEELKLIIHKGIKKLNVKLSEEAIKIIIDHSSGDARVAISILDFAQKTPKNGNEIGEEILKKVTYNNLENDDNCDKSINNDKSENICNKEFASTDEIITTDDIKRILQNFPSNDNKLDHSSFMSALQKSIRAGNTKAAILYLMKSLKNGEDPLYICRRLIRIASEDIGIANNEVLSVCINTHYACKTIGMPECQTSLIYAVILLCKSPKSNYIYLVSDYANKICEQYNFTVPFNLKNTSDKYVYTNQPDILSYEEHSQKYKNVQKYLPSHMEDVYLPPTP